MTERATAGDNHLSTYTSATVVNGHTINKNAVSNDMPYRAGTVSLIAANTSSKATSSMTSASSNHANNRGSLRLHPSATSSTISSSPPHSPHSPRSHYNTCRVSNNHHPHNTMSEYSSEPNYDALTALTATTITTTVPVITSSSFDESIPCRPQEGMEVQEIEMVFIEGWGITDYIGLTGIELIGMDGKVVEPQHAKITAEPRDLATVMRSNDVRKLENLFYRENITTSTSNMWLVPLQYNHNFPHLTVWLMNDE